MKFNHIITSLLAVSLIIIPSKILQAKTLSEVGFKEYVIELKEAALAQGFSQSLIDESFTNVKFHKRAVAADRKQPEKVETLDTYLPKRIPAWKVDKARALFKEHEEILTKIGQDYAVQPRFIVALWGLETNFGKFTGGYNVISALSTLAYEGRREAFFKKQLWAALTILKEGHIKIDDMKGSWAGAMGQNQFMPTSFLGYAVDGDGDGKKDIWKNQVDIFASMANYLQKEGWNNELTWGRQVKLPENFDTSLAIPQNTGSRKNWLKAWAKTEKKLAEWQALGIRRTDGTSLPNVDITAALVFPDGINGRAYLAYDNYKSLMHWNLSYYFVSSVGHLSDQIKYPPIQ
ncbi:lytic murein transglycosylase [Colwellia sp. 1_MG-2023]|jgi:membrane-bound lytic murein transglycosylase B|uniref:lytic murein transglycosylase n=1 Tax=unclassified Colwellia TaxID=196834 RepID=UPI001C08AAF5|nr:MULTISPECIES: lytic murein transglycosylase [unclassified Colwellia]MBU2924000.1 lytic murein transglycosylase [Colwellia sp. C2M11]MDO6488726.1 lytic murein transglycosylase [Colwellia sp. 6_MG-2023]MDO6653631.1 lytic murein transglycosylase [Colwellia sp. 3_MG-2023]MDO6666564.1 lytic murein transglycosylase [Colwellia sp. 2_MG-2023]MDO6691007.1 lytic murein transglycosylase [Colwellia sp. 1_MG-2023]